MKRAILFIGLPGSGKTTYIENKIRDFYIVSADDLKYSHPEFDPEHPELIHQWSVKQAEHLMNTLSDQHINLCMDSGGVNNSYSLRILTMLRNKGYHVEIIHMDTPLEVCLERNRNRERKVPEEVILEKSLKIDSCVAKQRVAAHEYLRISQF
jgi:predicted kinase